MNFIGKCNTPLLNAMPAAKSGWILGAPLKAATNIKYCCIALCVNKVENIFLKGFYNLYRLLK